MKVQRGEGGVTRPVKPPNERRFSCYQGRSPRYDYFIPSTVERLLLLVLFFGCLVY